MVEETFELSDIRVLDSKVRVEILRLLSRRRATVSELFRSLGMSKSTVFYHLIKLKESGFVTRMENGKRKWVYYELSERGRQVLKYRKVNIALLLTSSFFAMIAGILQMERYAALKPGVKGAHPESYLLYSGMAFIATSILLFATAFVLWWKQKQEL
jgi:DNA-binding transcriptional ArsR family regulator